MKVTMEPVTWVMRMHPCIDGDEVPYTGSAFVLIDERKVATIKGMVIADFSTDVWRAMEDALASVGVKAVIWTRRRHGQIRYLRRAIEPRQA